MPPLQSVAYVKNIYPVCILTIFFSFISVLLTSLLFSQPHMLRGCKEQGTLQDARTEDVFAWINSRPWGVPIQENRWARGDRDSPTQALLTQENAADFT